ncbi:MAG: potassium transporter KtrB [Clostridia bacterium]|nr:potassium transporter KtrB [Clostridia bacterium]
MKKRKALSSVQIVLLGFLGLVLLGSFLLSLPISSANGMSVPYIDALFTATTSVCVTGLVTVPTAFTWSVFGQVVILLLIQIGGLGVVTVMAAFMIGLKKKMGIDDRILISDSFNLSSMDKIVSFVKKVLALTFTIEGIGALLYMTVFLPEFGLVGIWYGIFHSVSAFCNAGIDFIGTQSLCPYVLNPVINFTTIFLIISGGLGFVVWFDIFENIRHKNRRGIRFLTLHTKIVLWMTAVLVIGGGVIYFLLERNNPLTIGAYTFWEKVMASLFQSVTTRTAGFATVPQENLTDASAFFSILLMFIGGSPAGTAGGVKTVTVFVLLVTALAVIRSKRTVDVFQRQIVMEFTKKALAVFLFSFLVVLASTFLLLVVQGGNLTDVLFETVSATATVGLTRNLTGSLNVFGKSILILTMYLGRVGPISLAFAFSTNKCRENLVVNPTEDIIVG